jgi:cell division initiation protein
MLTPQEVSARSFTKSVMGGYNMTMVDEFLDELTDDYTSLYKENASLKAKLKVLVEKVEEYRATEDSMRVTLLAAQRMAESIVQEAQEKAEEIKKQADDSAKAQIEEGRRELAATEQKLQEGKLALQKFIDEGKKLCGQSLEFLDRLPMYVPEADTKTAQIDQIEKKVMDAALDTQPAAPVQTQTPPAAPASIRPQTPPAAPASVRPQTHPAAPADVLQSAAKPAPGPVATPEPKPPVSSPTTKITVPAGAPEPAAVSVPEPPAEEAKPDMDATKRVNLDELKFGPRYRGEAR